MLNGHDQYGTCGKPFRCQDEDQDCMPDEFRIISIGIQSMGQRGDNHVPLPGSIPKQGAVRYKQYCLRLASRNRLGLSIKRTCADRIYPLMIDGVPKDPKRSNIARETAARLSGLNQHLNIGNHP